MNSTTIARKAEKAAQKSNGRPKTKTQFACDPLALKKIKLIAVAYSYVEREWFPTEEAYESEREGERRAG